MKTKIIFSCIGLLFVIFSCKTKQIQSNNYIIENRKYTRIIDNLPLENLPKVLKEFYFNLSEQDFFKPYIEVSKKDSLRTVFLKTRVAKSGYTYINEVTKKMVNSNTVYIINNETIKTKKDAILLMSLKRNNVIEIDTLNNKIKIITKR